MPLLPATSCLKRESAKPRKHPPTRTILPVPGAHAQVINALPSWISAVWRAGSGAARCCPKALRRHNRALILPWAIGAPLQVLNGAHPAAFVFPGSDAKLASAFIVTGFILIPTFIWRQDEPPTLHWANSMATHA